MTTPLVLYKPNIVGDFEAISQIPTEIEPPFDIEAMFELIAIARIGRDTLVLSDFTHAIFAEIVFTKDLLLDCVDLFITVSDTTLERQARETAKGLLLEILDGMLSTAAQVSSGGS